MGFSEGRESPLSILLKGEDAANDGLKKQLASPQVLTRGELATATGSPTTNMGRWAISAGAEVALTTEVATSKLAKTGLCVSQSRL